MAIASPPSAAESDGADEYQPKRMAAGKTTKKVPKNTKKPVKQVVEDDVYTAQDTVSLHSVHRMVDVSPETRKEWGVPEVSFVCVCVYAEYLVWFWFSVGVVLKCFGLAFGGGLDGMYTIFREAESDFQFVFCLA